MSDKNPPAKKINIEEKRAELTKRLWYSIENQDSYYVYIDKDGNVYDEQGFYMETIEPCSNETCPNHRKKIDNKQA